MTAVDVLGRAGGRPDALALVGPSGRWTYGALDALVDARAKRLVSEGIEPGRIAPAVLEPDVEGVVWMLAAWRIAAVPAPLNPRLAPAERRAATEALAEAPAGAQVVLWTSGTEGRPRGVALSFENLEASTAAAAERLSLAADDVWLASLSPAHVGGLVLVTRSLLLGATLIAAGGFDAGAASDLVNGTAAFDAPPVTHVSLVPTQLLRLLDARRGAPAPDGFRCALIGGAHAPAELVGRALRAGWPLGLTYGATEMCSQIATAPPERTRDKTGTVGRPLAGCDVRLSADGEILARGPTLALGYVVGSDPTGLAPVADADGWYHTGDLGRIDEDGDLWIIGRRADRIVSGGVTVDAVEVEEALRAHPAVIDACVVGVPDDTWGERVAAWVEPVVGELDLDELERWLREHVGAAKRPRRWHVAGGLPRNANGKIDRAAVRRVLEDE